MMYRTFIRTYSYGITSAKYPRRRRLTIWQRFSVADELPLAPVTVLVPCVLIPAIHAIGAAALTHGLRHGVVTEPSLAQPLAAGFLCLDDDHRGHQESDRQEMGPHLLKYRPKIS